MTTRDDVRRAWLDLPPEHRPKPCPFCGAYPVIHPVDPDSEGNAWGEVRCENDKCPAQPRVRDGIDVSDERGTSAYQVEAIRRWNRRSSESD